MPEFYLLEPYPYRERAGTLNRWRLGCSSCGGAHVSRYLAPAHYFCRACIQGRTHEHPGHLDFLYARARARLESARGQ